jgi:hypothetical protein
MERLMIKCAACGDGFVIAKQEGSVFRDFRFWSGSLKAFLDEHHAHADQTKLLGEQFPLEGEEREETRT